jgi:hypothetical protein
MEIVNAMISLPAKLATFARRAELVMIASLLAHPKGIAQDMADVWLQQASASVRICFQEPGAVNAKMALSPTAAKTSVLGIQHALHWAGAHLLGCVIVSAVPVAMPASSASLALLL